MADTTADEAGGQLPPSGPSWDELREIATSGLRDRDDSRRQRLLTPLSTEFLPLRSDFDPAPSFDSDSALFNPHLTSRNSESHIPFNPQASSYSPITRPIRPLPSPSLSHSVSPTAPLLITKEALMSDFGAGKIQGRSSVVGNWELCCPSCSEWVNLNITAIRPLAAAGQFTPLHNHMRGRNCKKPSSISNSPSFSHFPGSARRSSGQSTRSRTSSTSMQSRGPSVPPSPLSPENPFSRGFLQSPHPGHAPLPFAPFGLHNRYCPPASQTDRF